MESLEKEWSLGHARHYGNSGQDLQSRQGARQAIQKRTFTRWINMHLKECEPPVQVFDLFSDVQDGHVLMALLEQLSGCKMLYRFRPSTHRLFRVNNIAKVLNFLEDRNLKCKSIDASDVADGVPSAVLGLVWTIIVLFHIKKHTRDIRHILYTHSTRSIDTNTDASPISSSAKNYDWDCNTFPSKRKKSSATSKYRGTAIKTLLRWAQTCTSRFDVEVQDFGKSWRSGLAFLALIKSINPAIVDMRTAISRTPKENVEDAFRLAQSTLGIPPLLDVEDVITATPDEQSVIAYVTYFLEYKHKLDELNGLESHTRCFGTTTTPPDVAYSPSSIPAHHPSVIEPTLFPPVNDGIQSPLPNDVFGTSATNGKNSGNTSPGMINARRKASCVDILADIETLSLSSEEGVYTLSPLDSEEEEAYKYILALDEEANGISRQDVPANWISRQGVPANGISCQDAPALPVNSGIEHHSHSPHHIHCICQRHTEANSESSNTCITGHEEPTLAQANGDHEDDNHGASFSVEYKRGQSVSSEPFKAGDRFSDSKEWSSVYTNTADDGCSRTEDAPSHLSDSEMEESLPPDSDSSVESPCYNENTVDSESSSHVNTIQADDDVEREDQIADWMDDPIDNSRFGDNTQGESQLTLQTRVDALSEVQCEIGTITARDATSDTELYSDLDTDREEEMSASEEVSSEPSDSEVEDSLSPDSDSSLESHCSSEDTVDSEGFSHVIAIQLKDDVEDGEEAGDCMEPHQTAKAGFNGDTDADKELTPQGGSSLESESKRGTITTRDTRSHSNAYSNVHTDTEEEDVSFSPLDSRGEVGFSPDSDSGLDPQDSTVDIADDEDAFRRDSVKAEDVENDQTANSVESNPVDNGRFSDAKLTPQSHNFTTLEDDLRGTTNPRATNLEQCSNVLNCTEQTMSQRREDVVSSPTDNEKEDSFFPDSDSEEDEEEDGQSADGIESFKTDSGRLSDHKKFTEPLQQTLGGLLKGKESLHLKNVCGKDTGPVSQTQSGCSADREEEVVRDKDMSVMKCLNGQLPQRAAGVVQGAEQELETWNKHNIVNHDQTRERELSAASMGSSGVLEAREVHLLLYLWLFTYCFFIIRHGICRYFNDVLK